VYVAVEGGEGERVCSVVEQEGIYEGAMLGDVNKGVHQRL
jgi:hypothetical protein